MISARSRVFGKQVQSLYCPRNGKRVRVSHHATALHRIDARGKAGHPRVREMNLPILPSRVRRPAWKPLQPLEGVGEDAREVSMRHATAGILAGLCVSVCFAQDDAVVITATRFPEDVRRLPASVTVISEEEIARSPARTIPELLNSQAGFTMKDLFGSFASNRLGVNGSVYGYSSDGYRANNRNEQQNNTLNARLALGEGALDLRLGTDRQDVRLPGARRVQPSIGLDEYAADRRGAQTPLDFASRDGARAGVSLMQHSGEAEFSVGVDYRDKDQRSFFDQGGSPASRADKLDFTSLTPRLRLPFNNHTLVLGADWNSWRYRSRRADRPENIDRPANRVTVAQDTAGYYLQDTIEFSRATVATLGWRSERAKYAGDDSADP